jgi:hypothetical protein
MSKENDKNVDPDQYFKDVKKNRTKQINEPWLIGLNDIIEKKRKKAYISGQDYLLKKLDFTYKIIKRELELVRLYNINKCVQYQDLLDGITRVEGKAIKIIELSGYRRDIPDEIVALIKKLKDNKLFDEYYIVFTDYTHETSKEVALERQKKDPILFGAFIDKEDLRGKPNIHERLYFLADWEDEYCNLTYDKLLEANIKHGYDINIDLIKDVNEEDITNYINSFNKDLNDNKFMVNKKDKSNTKSFIRTMINKIIKFKI